MERPLVTVLLDKDGAFLIEADATGIEDGGRENGVRNSWQAMLVKLGRLDLACVDIARGVDKLLDRDISVVEIRSEAKTRDETRQA